MRRFLGRGGFGSVFAVYDQQRSTELAAKYLRNLTPASLMRFKREFRILAGIVHRNLVTLHELHASGEHWFYTMELIEGIPFRRWVRPDAAEAATRTFDFSGGALDEPGPPPPAHDIEEVLDVPRLRRAFAQLALGIDALHRAGKLHRDLKPSNVLVEADGRVVVLDFGLAMDLADDARSDVGVGTPQYVAPEQILEQASITEAADWYAVGVMLFEALTGVAPFPGSVGQILRAKQVGDGPDPRDTCAGLPDDLARLCTALLRRDPRERPGRKRVFDTFGLSDTATRGHRSPFVGRAAELALLEEAWHVVRGGRMAAVMIIGPSGVGKTALVERFLEGAEPAPTVLRGRCHERESVPYKALDSLVDGLASHFVRHPEAVVAMPPGTGALVMLFPVLDRVDAARRAAEADPAIHEPSTRRQAAADALRRILKALAARRPLVLSLDDTQWGDSDSAEVLGLVLGSPDPPPVLVVSACRGDGLEQPVPRVLQPLPGPSGPAHIALGGLGEGASRALIVHLFASAEERLVSRLLRETAGHPLLLEGFARHAHRVGDLPADVSIADVISEDVAALSVDQRTLLARIAVAGQPVHRDALRATSPRMDLEVALAALQARRLVRASGAVAPERVEPYHDRVRTAVVDALEPGELAEHHRALARALTAAGDTAPERLLVHYLGAGMRAAATRCALSAAAQASGSMAFAYAVQLLQQALDLGTLSPRRVAATRRKLAQALTNVGRGPEAAALFLACADDADTGEALDLRRRAAEQYLSAGHVEAGLGIVRQLLADLDLHYPPTPTRALVAFLRWRLLAWRRGLQFTPRSDREVPTAALHRIDTLWAVATGLSVTDTIRGGVFHGQALLLALDAGEPRRIVRALAMEAAYHGLDGEPARARVATLIRRCEEVAGLHPHPHGLGMVTLARGVTANCRAEYGGAVRHLHTAEHHFARCRSVNWELNTARMFLVDSLRWSGNWRALAAEIPRLRAVAAGAGNLQLEMAIATAEAALFVAADDPEPGRERLDALIARWPRKDFHIQHWWHASVLGDADRYAGRPEAALTRLDDVWPRMRAAQLHRIRLTAFQVHWTMASCVLALAARRTGWRRRALLWRARRHLRHVAASRFAHSVAVTSLLRAEWTWSSGDETARLAHLDAAADRFEAAGFPLHASACGRAVGLICGGEAGRARAAAAEGELHGLGVRDPDRMMRMVLLAWPA